MVDHSVPDYDLPDSLRLNGRQMKVVFHDTRSRIIDLLTERAASTSQLATALGIPKGTVGHHCKTLEDAGLITVVRTRRVRALEERFYGRTARVFVFGRSESGQGTRPAGLIQQALDELDATADLPHLAPLPSFTSARFARIPEERAVEWEARLAALAEEFADQSRGGTHTYGVLLGLFATDRRGFDDGE
ncbi:MAG: winged helix-turn-helix transcriptional regulator [Actinomycetia bacterium]|nr:winged helix-turn-helix transcriptional regulator [Actinomycetes bacterium]